MYSAKCLRANQMTSELWKQADAWRHANASYASPFFSIEFTKIIARTRPDLRIFVLFEDATEDPVAIWPLHVTPSHWARPLSGPFSDRNGPLIRPGYQLSLEALLDAFQLHGVVSAGLLSDPCLSVRNVETGSSNLAVIDCNFDDYLTVQKKKYKRHYKNLARLNRKMEQDYPGFEFEFDDRNEDRLFDLLQMKQEQYAATNRHNVLGPNWARDMLAELWRSRNDDSRAVLSTLHYQGELIAGELNLRSNHYLHGWIVGYNQKYDAYSPGNQLQLQILKHMKSQGITHYDAGPGAPYFKYYANETSPLLEGTFKAGTTPLTPTAALREMWSQMEKRSPERVQKSLGKIRRRADMILSSEVSTMGRLQGFSRAAIPFLRRADND